VGYYARMQRTTLSLPDDLAFALKREAHRRHTSVSAVAREALAVHFDVLAGPGSRKVPFAALGRSGDGRRAAEPDDALAEIYEEAERDARGGRGR
jgi:Ribbon-helix-helix protein, copG family